MALLEKKDKEQAEQMENPKAVHFQPRQTMRDGLRVKLGFEPSWSHLPELRSDAPTRLKAAALRYPAHFECLRLNIRGRSRV
jgi:hypothetical protein